MPHLDLLTSDEWFTTMHEVADGAPAPKPPKVFREALLRLLIDHTNMVRALTDRGYRINTPTPPRERVKLKS